MNIRLVQQSLIYSQHVMWAFVRSTLGGNYVCSRTKLTKMQRNRVSVVGTGCPVGILNTLICYV